MDFDIPKEIADYLEELARKNIDNEHGKEISL